MSSFVKGIDSIPDYLAKPINGLSFDIPLVAHIFYKKAGMPFQTFYDTPNDSFWPKLSIIQTIKTVLSVLSNVSFIRQNWKQFTVYQASSSIKSYAVNFLDKNIISKFVCSSRFQILTEDNSLLQKVRFIFPLVLIPAVTLMAQPCLEASCSFFATRRGAPWTTLLASWFIFDLHGKVLNSLSTYQKLEPRKGSLLSLGDYLKSKLFTVPELERIKAVQQTEAQESTLTSRVRKTVVIARQVFSAPLLSKFFITQNPFWIQTAMILLSNTAEQIATKYFLQFE